MSLLSSHFFFFLSFSRGKKKKKKKRETNSVIQYSIMLPDEHICLFPLWNPPRKAGFLEQRSTFTPQERGSDPNNSNMLFLT